MSTKCNGTTQSGKPCQNTVTKGKANCGQCKAPAPASDNNLTKNELVSLGNGQTIEPVSRFETGEEAWAHCLTQNSGISILDSGGQNGRGWQTAKKAVEESGQTAAEYFNSLPEVKAHISRIDENGIGEFDYVSVNVFHTLRDNTTFDAEEDAKFNAWRELPDNQDTSELQTAYNYAEEMGWTDVETHYTYNWENMLSRDVHWTEGEGPDGVRRALVSIHTGADARGGFSTPVVINLEESAEMWHSPDVWYYFDGPDEKRGFGRSDDYIDWHGFGDFEEPPFEELGWDLKVKSDGSPNNMELAEHKGWSFGIEVMESY